MKNNLDVLLQAAEYLERKEREMEHGYASTLPMPEDYHLKPSGSPYSSSSSPSPTGSKGHRRTRNKNKLHNNRTTHNELEKNRRAHLRTYLEKLKEIVPRGPDGAKHTTLGLLKRAKFFIQNLEDKGRTKCSQREQLQKHQRHLRRRLEMLSTNIDNAYKRRSVSESSTESSSSSSASSSYSESDEVDILGYGSNQSDTDDHSSERGVIQSTRRLTIDETSSSPPALVFRSR